MTAVDVNLFQKMPKNTPTTKGGVKVEWNQPCASYIDSNELKKGTKHTAITFTTTDASLASLNCSSSEDLFLVKGR